MAPRSAKRLVSAGKSKSSTRRKSPSRKASPKKPPSFACYRIVDGMSVSYFEKRADAVEYIASSGAGGLPQKITVSSNADLVKLMRENTL